MSWSKPIIYDLGRTMRRASVPKLLANVVPKLPGVYVIVQLDKAEFQERILYIGKAGLRNTRGLSDTMGLSGRIASGVAHSASERIASEIRSKTLPNTLKVIWLTIDTGEEAKLEDGLLTLFKREFGRRPHQNINGGNTANADVFRPEYDALKQHIMAL